MRCDSVNTNNKFNALWQALLFVCARGWIWNSPVGCSGRQLCRTKNSRKHTHKSPVAHSKKPHETIETNKKCIKQFMTSVPSFTSNLPFGALYGTHCVRKHIVNAGSPVTVYCAAVDWFAIRTLQLKTDCEPWGLATRPSTSWCTTATRSLFIQCEYLCIRWIACRIWMGLGLYIFMQTNHIGENVSIFCAFAVVVMAFFFWFAKDSIVITKTLMAFW